jgi:drug/metabolite transporter (DMT)-like permease
MPEELPPFHAAPETRMGPAARAHTAFKGLAPNIQGALWMLASAVSFTAMTSLIKLLGSDYPAALQTFYRSAAGLFILLPLILRDWRGAFRTTRLGILLFRSGAGTFAMILSFYAFQKLPLAEANALSFTRTLWLVPLAFFVLREKLGGWRIGAALVGFAGVSVMLAPGFTGGGHGFGWAQIAALTSAGLFAMTITGMKVMTRDHSPFTLLVYAAVLGVVFSVPPALFVWAWPKPVDFLLLCAMGVIGMITQACYIKGMQIGDAAAMAPIDYTRLVFTAVVGLVFFHEIPSWTTIVGAVIVVAATLIITWREQRAARLERLAQAPVE